VKPKRGPANVTCWTCDKVGHYLFECKEPNDEPKDMKDDAKPLNNLTTATIELNDNCGGAWATEEVGDIMEGLLLVSDVANELDWFERAITEMDHDAEWVVMKIPMWDWFDDVVEERVQEQKRRLEGPFGRWFRQGCVTRGFR